MDSEIRFGKIININLKEQRARGKRKARLRDRKVTTERFDSVSVDEWRRECERMEAKKRERGKDDLRERAGRLIVRYSDGAEQRRRC